MRLVGKLLGGESKAIDNLDRKLPRIRKPVRIEYNLGDHLVVRYHHCNWPEKHFEGIRQLGSTSVAWVHSDEDSAG
jgi:hypothetical protein